MRVFPSTGAGAVMAALLSIFAGWGVLWAFAFAELGAGRTPASFEIVGVDGLDSKLGGTG
jgi:hypothetical protein